MTALVHKPPPLAVIFLGCCLASIRMHDALADEASAPPPAAAQVFPGAEWETQIPAEAGLDAQRLDAMSQYVGGFGCVVRGGRLVYTWGDAAKRADIASCCKPWYTHFLFKAIEDGKLKSLDEPLVNTDPRLAELNANVGHKDRAILWRHLASQTSCYGVAEAPGTAFDYSDYNMALLFDNLFLKLYGATIETATVEVLNRQLTDLLQCQDAPRFNGKGRLAVSPRDFARFGLLYLRGGNWRGRQLLTPQHVGEITTSPLPAALPRTVGQPAEMLPGQRSIGGGSNQTDHYGSYSFTWWINGLDRRGNRHWPDAPLDALGAFGHKGKRAMVLLPSQDLIVVWNEAQIVSPEMENRALQLLLAALNP